VGRPSESIAQPSGIFSSRSAAIRMRPRAMLEHAMSSTIGSGRQGIAQANGLLLRIASRPPHGAMSAGALLRNQPIMPASVA
jgi:hypothetical protein